MIINNTNYGNLVKVNTSEIVFIVDEFYLQSLVNMETAAITAVDQSEVYTDLAVNVEKSTFRTIFCYATNRKDAIRVAKELSISQGVDVTIIASARILARFNAGRQVGDLKTLDDFYTDVTPEERAATALL